MHCNCHSIVHRAVVTYSDSSTGEIRVRVPAVTGLGELSISKIGRSTHNGQWVVPPSGEQIVVSADDENMTNVFWIQVSGVSPAQTIQTIESVTTRNIQSTDAGKFLTSSTNCTLTLTSSSGFVVGERFDVVRLAGTLTISQGAGSTVLYTPANTLRAINSAASVVCIAPNTYLLVGDLG